MSLKTAGLCGCSVVESVGEKGGILMDYYTVYPSPVGRLTLAGDGEHLTGLWMEGQKY